MIIKGEAFFVDGVAYSTEENAKKALLRSRVKAAIPANNTFNTTVRGHAIEMILNHGEDIYAAMKSVYEA